MLGYGYRIEELIDSLVVSSGSCQAHLCNLQDTPSSTVVIVGVVVVVIVCDVVVAVVVFFVFFCLTFSA